MTKFHTLKVANIKRPTGESVSITFEIPDNLKKIFTFKQGQHLTLKKNIKGKNIRRSYSICSCPIDKHITVVIKELKGGIFSTYANNELVIGDEIEVMPPRGNFFVTLNPVNKNRYIAFASGSGITPIISIIETTLRIETQSVFILFYGNRRTSTIIFQEELEALKNKYMNRFSLYHILSREQQESNLFNGRIDKEKIQSYAHSFFNPQIIDHYFICGPEEMMLAVKDKLHILGVQVERIHLELFTSPASKFKNKTKELRHEKAFAKITIILDGKSMSFPYDSNKSILDVAYDNGINLPFACKGGVCSTCVACIQEGEVKMDVNYALNSSELKRGLVLTCQSYPKTNIVKLNYDV